MRVSRSVFRVQSDQFHQIEDLLSPVLPVRVELMDIQRFPDDILDRHTRIQGRIRILEDHLHVLAEPRHGLLIDPLAVKVHISAGRLVQTEKGASDRGLAAS